MLDPKKLPPQISEDRFFNALNIIEAQIDVLEDSQKIKMIIFLLKNLCENIDQKFFVECLSNIFKSLLDELNDDDQAKVFNNMFQKNEEPLKN